MKINAYLIFCFLFFDCMLAGNLSASSYLYVSSENSVVYRYDISTKTREAFISGNGLSYPRGIEIGPDGTIYVAGRDSNAIFHYSSSGTFINKIVTGVDSPYDLIYHTDGNIYVALVNNSVVNKYNGTTGAFLGTFASGNGLALPYGITFGPDGNFYVASRSSSRSVLRYNGSTGAFMDTFASGNGLTDPVDIAFGPDGYLYVTNSSAYNVLRFDASTGAYEDVFATMTNNHPYSLDFGPDGYLYVSCYNTNKILRYDISTKTLVDEFATGISGPTFLTFSSSGSFPSIPEPISFILLFCAVVSMLSRKSR